MKKNKLNLLIDAILIILVGMLAGGGFLVYYILLPGQECKDKYGPFTELHFWGMDRHEWADIHLFLCFFFLAFTLLHIILHWEMVVSMTRNITKKGKKHLLVIWITITVTILLILLPFFATPELSEKAPQNYGRFYKNRYEPTGVNATHEKTITPETNEQKTITKNKKTKTKRRVTENHYRNQLEEQIKGSQSLIAACNQLGIDADKLCEKLNIPTSEKGERLGRLKRKYRIEMTEIKEEMIGMHLAKKQ